MSILLNDLHRFSRKHPEQLSDKVLMADIIQGEEYFRLIDWWVSRDDICPAVCVGLRDDLDKYIRKCFGVWGFRIGEGHV